MNQITNENSLLSIPKSPEEVIPSFLDPDFRNTCIENLTDLVSEMQSCVNKTSFLVGAGISVFQPARIPLANQVLIELFKYSAEYLPEINDQVQIVLNAINNGEIITFENTLQHLLEVIHPKPFYLPYIFDNSNEPLRYNLNHEFLARWLKKGCGTVLTTNLDTLIEQAWIAINKECDCALPVVKRPKEFSSWINLINSPALFKLHGTGDDPNSWNVNLSSVASELNDHRASLIKFLLPSHNICFVGWKAADTDIFPCFSHALREQNSDIGTKMFWVYYSDNSCKSLNDYFAREPNTKYFFDYGNERFKPIVTTAEKLFAYLEYEVYHICRELPAKWTKYSTNYDPIKLDVHSANEYGIKKLTGYVLRNLGKHENSLEAFDTGAAHAIARATQLLQEAAITYFENGLVREARTRIEKAWRLFNEINDPAGQSWCKFGRITMSLEDKTMLLPFKKAFALIQLSALQSEFSNLALDPRWWDANELGVLYCKFHKLKISEEFLTRLSLIKIPVVRKYFINSYEKLKRPVQAPGLASMLVALHQKIAILYSYDSPQESIDEIKDAIQLARVIGVKTYKDTLDLAIDISKKFDNIELLNYSEKEKKSLGGL